jgi:hypothetical protein
MNEGDNGIDCCVDFLQNRGDAQAAKGFLDRENQRSISIYLAKILLVHIPVRWIIHLPAREAPWSSLHLLLNLCRRYGITPTSEI